MAFSPDFFTAREPTHFIEYAWEGKVKRLYGGSFFQAPDSGNYLTINLMQEYPQLASDLYLPIKDYSIPTDVDKMVEIFDQIKTSEQDAYVGCFGGIGRTGLFMSCFLKHLGYDRALQRVRAQYNERAVETREQMEFLYYFGTPTSHPKPSF